MIQSSWCMSRRDSILLALKISLHSDLHRGCTNLHSHLQWPSVPSLSILASVFHHLFPFDRHVMGKTQSFKVILIWISLVASDIEHLHRCLLDSCVASFEFYLFCSIVHSLTASFLYVKFSELSSHSIISPLSAIQLAKTFILSLRRLPLHSIGFQPTLHRLEEQINSQAHISQLSVLFPEWHMTFPVQFPQLEM